jgi:hypothetical protein
MVMTVPEFLQEEAERDNAETGGNKTGGDIMRDIISSMVDDDRQTEEHMKQDALKSLQRVCSQEIECWFRDRKYGVYPRPHYPVRLVELLDVKHHQRFNGSNSCLKARVVCDDLVVRVVTLEAYESYGTRLEPPDHEENVNWS